MKTSFSNERLAQDAFRSMVGETGAYPDDPQHPDPGFDVNAPIVDKTTNDQCDVVDECACSVA